MGDIHIHVDGGSQCDVAGGGNEYGGDIVTFEFAEDNDNSSTLMSDEGSLTLSARITGGRRRSSSSIRFADDTDTGTDILVITEETLEDILADPIYGNMTLPRRHSLLLSAIHPLTGDRDLMSSSPIESTAGFLQVPSARHHVKRLSLVPPFHHRHLLQGVHGMAVGGSGQVAYPQAATNEDDRATQSRILLTLRRRKSVHQSIHIDPIALLDYSYHGVVNRFLKNSANWRFNSFTLDTMTGGHSLSQLLFYIFNHYNFIDHFNLDIICVWKCFREY